VRRLDEVIALLRGRVAKAKPRKKVARKKPVLKRRPRDAD
jgi:hypothetical protein